MGGLFIVLFMASLSTSLATMEKSEDVKCKNILFFFGACSKSQEITFMPLAKSVSSESKK